MQTFKVDGMTCGHCERAITKAIQGLDARAKVQVERRAGIVETDSDLPAERLAEAIRVAGYGVTQARS
jgi:copper chaperone